MRFHSATLERRVRRGFAKLITNSGAMDDPRYGAVGWWHGCHPCFVAFGPFTSTTVATANLAQQHQTENLTMSQTNRPDETDVLSFVATMNHRFVQQRVYVVSQIFSLQMSFVLHRLVSIFLVPFSLLPPLPHPPSHKWPRPSPPSYPSDVAYNTACLFFPSAPTISGRSPDQKDFSELAATPLNVPCPTMQ